MLSCRSRKTFAGSNHEEVMTCNMQKIRRTHHTSILLYSHSFVFTWTRLSKKLHIRCAIVCNKPHNQIPALPLFVPQGIFQRWGILRLPQK
ncbi:MAG: hypothetical protein EA399_05485 [Desulfovibrionales bacterium]|nr:MAG: hypothetical protein EA399_05485 [Desulfovibrionales bacterium]